MSELFEELTSLEIERDHPRKRIAELESLLAKEDPPIAALRHERNVLQKICAERSDDLERQAKRIAELEEDEQLVRKCNDSLIDRINQLQRETAERIAELEAENERLAECCRRRWRWMQNMFEFLLDEDIKFSMSNPRWAEIVDLFEFELKSNRRRNYRCQ